MTGLVSGGTTLLLCGTKVNPRGGVSRMDDFNVSGDDSSADSTHAFRESSNARFRKTLIRELTKGCGSTGTSQRKLSYTIALKRAIDLLPVHVRSKAIEVIAGGDTMTRSVSGFLSNPSHSAINVSYLPQLVLLLAARQKAVSNASNSVAQLAAFQDAVDVLQASLVAAIEFKEVAVNEVIKRSIRDTSGRSLLDSFNVHKFSSLSSTVVSHALVPDLWNNTGSCTYQKCRYSHKCTHCGGDHAGHTCANKK